MKKFKVTFQLTDENNNVFFHTILTRAKVESEAEMDIKKQLEKDGCKVRFLETRVA